MSGDLRGDSGGGLHARSLSSVTIPDPIAEFLDRGTVVTFPIERA
jgi:hypothetical protein